MNTFNHPYYQQSKAQKKRFWLKLGALFITSIAIVGVIGYFSELYILPIFFIIVALSMLAPFVDTPTMVKSGKLRYFSCLFLVEKEQKGVLIIHGGTLFDYYFVLDRKLPGKQRTRFILFEFLSGLINLIEHYEKEGFGDLTIRGTSYIINERTAQKIGLSKQSQDGLQTMILFYNYFNLTASNSLAKGQLAFPKLANTLTLEGKLSEIAQNKAYLVALKEKLQN